MESNSRYTFFLKHMFLGIAILSLFTGLMGFLFDDIVTINGTTRNLDQYELLGFISLTVLMIIFWLFVKERIVKVKLSGQKITIDYGDDAEDVNWLDVKQISQLKIIQPPLYKLELKDHKSKYYFVTQPHYVSFGFGVTDTSNMGSFIKRKKRELQI